MSLPLHGTGGEEVSLRPVPSGCPNGSRPLVYDEYQWSVTWVPNLGSQKFHWGTPFLVVPEVKSLLR